MSEAAKNQFEITPQDKAILALSSIDGIDNKKLVEGLSQQADAGTLADVKLEPTFESVSKFDNPAVKAGLNSGKLNEDSFKAGLAAADATQATAKKDGIHVLSPFNDQYPKEFLRGANDLANPIVYAKGNTKLLNDPDMVTTVGTRYPDDVARLATKNYVDELVDQKQGTVAGLAKGVDTDVAKSTLDAGGKHIAWIPNGLDKPIYPKENRTLASELVNSGQGVIASTAPLNEPAAEANKNFVPRVIDSTKQQVASGNGVLVVSALKAGGTKYTVQNAKELGRPVAVTDFETLTNGNDKAINAQYSHLDTATDVKWSREDGKWSGTQYNPLTAVLEKSAPKGVTYDPKEADPAKQSAYLNEVSLNSQYAKDPTVFKIAKKDSVDKFVNAANENQKDRQKAPLNGQAKTDDFGLDF